MTIIASVLLLVSATEWEGVTDVVASGDLPGIYSVATNSFPRNTVVDITNLENGKMVRVMVVAGLEATGLLATLSLNAAESIDLRHGFTCRIRMTQPSDDIAFSHFKLGPIIPSLPDSESDTLAEDNVPAKDAVVAHNAANASDTPNASNASNKSVVTNVPGATGVTGATNTTRATDATGVTNTTGVADAKDVNAPGNQAGMTHNVTAMKEPAASDMLAAADDVITAEAYAGNPPESGGAFGRLSLIPAEERPPSAANQYIIAPADTVSPERPASETPVAEDIPSVDFSPFQAPLISRLEPDKWYVQVGVYTRSDNVEDEISRIGTAYPLAVQNIGTDASPIFRILLGPLNQGESGAMLQRFKSIGYTDAFVRRN